MMFAAAARTFVPVTTIGEAIGGGVGSCCVGG